MVSARFLFSLRHYYNYYCCDGCSDRVPIGLVLIVILTHFYFSFIYQRSNRQLVLAVTTPPLGNDSFAMDCAPAQGFEGAAVVVAHRKSCANGNANQLWRFDSISGLIEAMAADTINKGTPSKP